MSNIETRDLPPKIGLRFSSALIMRRSLASWSPFRLIYAHSFLVTSVRGMGVEPTTVASCALGVIGFMNAAFGFRFDAVFFRADFFTARFRAAGRRAAFLADFFADLFAFFLVAIASLLLRVKPALPRMELVHRRHT